MKATGNLLILAGIGILVFLIGGGYWQAKQTGRLLEEFERLPFQDFDEKAQGSGVGAGDKSEGYTGPVTKPAPDRAIMTGEVIALLEIDQIDLKVPVVQGAGAKQMSTAVGHLESSGDLGQPGHNFAVAGHRSRTFGQFFNRLDELELQDRFTIRTPNEIYTYIVINKKVLNPSDVDVILPVEGKSLITLITCHPLRSNEKRLIVQAEKVNQSPAASPVSVESNF
ncbi:class D sortase [Paenibacillus nasutitermitis]|uniref:Sortase A n=1 Tax=Paenibacillus nasutitermitis TaxID=1652958 RepID=A0A917E1Z8_9BACL|nr:class D sortase [Paenibacillus nasutitermitis]GGD91101.1 hypothetical protein GCM10010911_57240 [Paenibacillus nasutitermitis]